MPVVVRYTDEEVTLLCQTVYGEAGICSAEEQALVAWCVLNRVDYYDSNIKEVVTAEGQFHGYDPEHPVTDEIKEVVMEVLDAWCRGEEALVLAPYATTSEYLYFWGDGTHNWFREEY